MLSAFAAAVNNDIRLRFRGISPPAFLDLLAHGCRDMSAHEAVLIEDADEILVGAVSDQGESLRHALQLLSNRQISRRQGQSSAYDRFLGQVFLQVSHELDAELGAHGAFYRDLPKLRIPPFTEMRRRMTEAGRTPSHARNDVTEVVKFMLADIAADPFDVAVMAAYDWDLGFDGQSAGVDALRLCAEWMASVADEASAPAGKVIERLTATPEGRASIYANLDKASLLRLILELIVQSHHEDVCLQSAAFLYFKTICTLGNDNECRQAAAEFWATRGIFRKLLSVHEFRLNKDDVGRWPPIEDRALYVWADEELEKPRSIATRLADRLSRSLEGCLPDANSCELGTIRALLHLGEQGRKNGLVQLGVMNTPYRVEGLRTSAPSPRNMSAQTPISLGRPAE
jgi:hypothetical protein